MEIEMMMSQVVQLLLGKKETSNMNFVCFEANADNSFLKSGIIGCNLVGLMILSPPYKSSVTFKMQSHKYQSKGTNTMLIACMVKQTNHSSFALYAAISARHRGACLVGIT